MPIQVKCPNADCAKAIRVHDELAGKAVCCPACKTIIRLPSLVTTAGAPAATKPAAPLAPAPKPAPSPEKTSPKPPPPEEEEVPTLDGFDDLPPAKGKITSKPAPVAKKDEFDDFDEFTDEAPKKPSKPKKDELDLPKKAKGKMNDFTDEPPRRGSKAKAEGYDDDDDAPKKKGKAKKRDADLDDLPDTLWEDSDLFRHERLSSTCAGWPIPCPGN